MDRAISTVSHSSFREMPLPLSLPLSSFLSLSLPFSSPSNNGNASSFNHTRLIGVIQSGLQARSFVSTRPTFVIIACASWMMGWYAYSRGNRRGNPRPWISSPSVVRNDPRSCRENLSRPLVLGSRQEPRGLRREGEARRYVGGGEDGVGGRRWWIVVVAGWRWR